ncbi:MAG: VWA domain-containing protein [Anaerolineales bacterium]|nr:VWA domain-containing protein [Anaerolineales bacterium]
MRFATPVALLLLLTLPYFFWLGRTRAAGRRDWRAPVSLGLRLLIVSLLTLSLAGAQTVRAADELAVVFLVDASDSISPEQQAQAEAYVRQAIAGMKSNDQAAVVVFGANALVERPMSGLAELAPVSSVPRSLHTDLAEAIRLGLALFPAGAARRMVILSDGAATNGDTAAAARVAATTGVQIDVVPLTRPGDVPEVMITGVNAPTRVVAGEGFRLTVTVESTGNMPASLRILANGSIISEQPVELRAGINNYSIRLQATAQEFARYTAQIVPTQDTYYQNNQLAAFTEIVGPPRVLLVAAAAGQADDGSPIPDESPQLQLALEAAGLLVDRATPAELPAALGELSNYASIILVDVNAKELSPRKMEALQTYVRDLGGGLVTVGGPSSYGMGGYFRTPLEETLPLEMQIKDQERFPSVSMVIVIDRSGSMGAPEGGVTKIQLAAEGAARVVQLLNDFDDITIIPTDTRPDNPIGPVSAADKESIIARIRQIGAGGGGIYVRTGLEAAAQALASSSNQVKHVIVLADGGDSEQKEGVPELLDALTAGGTTISFVSIGNGTDVPWLQDMAQRGNGRFHFTDRAANLPQIFTQETTSIQRSYLIEERFFPTLVTRSPILQGIAAVPPLYGYVGTSAKGAAQVILETHMGDPLLASWQYGLGRSVAWTSDATGRWGVDWVRWEGFPTFWAQVVRWTISQDRESNVETVVTLAGESARLLVDARDSGGAFLDNLGMTANVVAPDGRTQTVTLPQVAPGRYEGAFVPAEEGAYFVRVAGISADEATNIGQTSGWVLGYSPEYRQVEANPALLQEVAALTNGRDAGEDPAIVFSHDLPSDLAVRPIWPWLLLAAVVLLPFDIAARRLVITRRDVARAWAATVGRYWPQAAPRPQRSEQVARLFQAKERAGTQPTGEPPPPETISPPPGIILPPTPRQDAGEPPPEPAPPRAPASGGSLAARLLEKKREQEGEK